MKKENINSDFNADNICKLIRSAGSSIPEIVSPTLKLKVAFDSLNENFAIDSYCLNEHLLFLKANGISREEKDSIIVRFKEMERVRKIGEFQLLIRLLIYVLKMLSSYKRTGFKCKVMKEIKAIMAEEEKR